MFKYGASIGISWVKMGLNMKFQFWHDQTTSDVFQMLVKPDTLSYRAGYKYRSLKYDHLWELFLLCQFISKNIINKLLHRSYTAYVRPMPTRVRPGMEAYKYDRNLWVLTPEKVWQEPGSICTILIITSGTKTCLSQHCCQIKSTINFKLAKSIHHNELTQL